MKYLVEKLNSSPMYKFMDWPNRDMPSIAAGIYTIYDNHGQFIYVGMAGADLNEFKINDKIKSNKRSGLFDRLNSHANGYRSGDRFNIYIGDLFILPILNSNEIKKILDKELSFDTFIKNYIRKNLSYKYLITPNTVVRELEKFIQVNGINGELPSINAKG